MKYLLLLFLILGPTLSYSKDSLIYRQFSAGINFASLSNATPEFVAEFVLNEIISAKLDAGYRPFLNTLELSKKLANRKVGGSYFRIGIRYYNRTHARRKRFFTGAGIILASYKATANIVVHDYYNSFKLPQYAKQFTYGASGNIGFERNLSTKLIFEYGCGYNFLLNRNDSLLNHYAYFSSAQPGLGNFSLSTLKAGFSNGISLSLCLRYLLYYRNDKLKKQEVDFVR